MCTPALRELKLKNPNCFIRFYTDFPTLVRGLPYIDEVLSFADKPNDAIILQYEDVIPPRAHIARIIGDTLGLSVRDVRPDCVFDAEAIKHFRALFESLVRPHIVVQRKASSWTPNKDWPEAYWIELIRSLSKRASVIEVGNEETQKNVKFENYLDLRGQTTIEEFVAAIAAADAVIGPVSGPIHVAAAAGIPAVEIVGGYEKPINTSYCGNVPLYTNIACSPCWLRTPCPYNLECLRLIEPKTVAEAVWELLRTAVSSDPPARRHLS
jgi:ADP-heptose:LPS heptosyltransferase